MKKSFKILLLNNKPVLATKLQDYLSGIFGKVDCLYETVDAKEVLSRNEYDLLVLSNRLNDMDGIDFVRWMRTNVIQVPFVMIAGDGDVRQAVEAMKEGAEEFLQWSDDADNFFPYVAEVVRKALGRRGREKFFSYSELLYETLFENIRDAVFLHFLDQDTGMPGTFMEVNEVACQRLGYTKQELLAMTPADIDVPGVVDFQAMIKRLKEDGFAVFKARHRTKSGREIPTEINTRIFDLKGHKAILSVARNITDQQKALDDLRNSEHRFKSIIKSCIIGICITDENGLFEFVNEEYCKIYGYKPEDMLGRHFTMVVPEKDREYMSSLHDDFIQYGKDIKGNWTVIDKKGDEHYIVADATRIKDESGRFRKVTFVDDITQRKKAKEALEISEVKYRTMMENLQDPVMISDNQYKIVYVNGAFKKRIGPVQENFTCHEQVFGLKEPCPWCMVAKENMSRFRKRQENRINKRDYQITTVPVTFDGDNKTKMTIFRDVTKVVKARQQAEESDRLKSAFLANISHEIRTPLNVVMGFAGLLKEDDITRDEALMYIDMINESSQHLLHVMDDIIDFSFIDSGLVQVHPIKIKSKKLLDDLMLEVENYKKKMAKPQLQVSIRNELPENVNLATDESRLRQILLNLLSNAVKFTEHGGITITLSYTESRWVLFSVEDTGIGIPAKMHKVIFRRFRQADEGHTRMFGGNGLGLALCKHLAQMLGGHIELKSKPGKGSEFLLFLPEFFDKSLAKALSVNMIS
jgi:PAS domain S-box-containing protein